jgi:omega-hydroxy-beta-dihydromenaquinone-9 sulfotransferase
MPGFLSRFFPVPYFPYPHFMALAPLDVWARLLFFPRATIPIRYWPRLLFALATSFLSTLVTLPERLIFYVFLRCQRSPSNQSRAPVFILGYYRSGTTHLQYLLSRDPNFFSPTWVHTLVPQGFILTWTFLRFFLIPFMPSTRQVDPMLFGPDAPSEDDFALNNWALASALAGRAVLPQAYEFYGRFHNLRHLTASELSRWRRYQVAFVHKISLIARHKKLLLKSPSHTARVRLLLELFPQAKFIHVTRDPRAVVRSNIALLQLVQRLYNMEDPLPKEAIEPILVREYLATEQSYLEARARMPGGQITEVRFQDLLADPIGEIHRVYRELELPLSQTFERRLSDYLASVQAYNPNVHPDWTEDKDRKITSELAPLIKAFAHDQPAISPVKPPRSSGHANSFAPTRQEFSVLAGFGTALLCAALWLMISHLTHNRHDWLVWPAGIAIGYSTLRATRAGSRNLGSWSALLTLIVLLGVGLANTLLVDYAGRPSVSLSTITSRAARRLTHGAYLFWCYMGIVSAYRLGSRPRLT